jgi:RNA polymerase primary sigma factor
MRKTKLSLKNKKMRQLKIGPSITNRSDQSLEKYLGEINKVNLLTTEEEVTLARKIRETGDEKALEKLIKANLRFVVSVAKQHQGQGMTLGDLINEGNLGLIKAAKRFDETKGFKFISYAVWWIRQAILQAIANQSRIIRLPLNQIGSRSKINKMSSKLEQEYEREPTPEELAEALEETVYHVCHTLGSPDHHASLDAPYLTGKNKDSEQTLLDVLSNGESSTDSIVIHDGLAQEIERSLLTIKERERAIIVLFFGLGTNHPLSLEEIGEKFELTRERVRQIKDQALKRLQMTSRSKILKSYLG